MHSKILCLSEVPECRLQPHYFDECTNIHTCRCINVSRLPRKSSALLKAACNRFLQEHKHEQHHRLDSPYHKIHGGSLLRHPTHQLALKAGLHRGSCANNDNCDCLHWLYTFSLVGSSSGWPRTSGQRALKLGADM